MISIDGSFGEGGGQILRTSLSLAALTGKDVTVDNIRAGRDKPGLRPQHLTAALAVAQICGAEMTGAEVGSTRLTFRPHAIEPGSYEFDVARIRASAGSVNLILQTILWPLAFADRPSRITIKGGTHVPFAPTSDYVNEVFLPAVARMGLLCDHHMVRAGYYPIGGGEVRLEIRPVQALQPVSLVARSEPARAEVISAVSNLPASIADRQLSTGLARLRRAGVEAAGETREYPSSGKGTAFFIALRAGDAVAGFQSLGELRKRAETVAEEACEAFEAYLRSGMAVDEHLADQLIVPMALAGGTSHISTSTISQHLITNVAVVERFIDAHFHISRGLGEPGVVEKAESGRGG